MPPGARVLIADMPTYNGGDRRGVLVRQIREAIAEENRKDILERLWKGRQERVRRGLPPGGTVPYGYRREGKALTIESNEAGAVRTIFELADPGGTASRLPGFSREGPQTAKRETVDSASGCRYSRARPLL